MTAQRSPEPAVDENPAVFGTGILYFENARTDGRDHRLMADEHPEIALAAGDDDHVDILGNQETVG